MEISLQELCSILHTSRPTLRRKIQELNIQVKQKGKEKLIQEQDIEKIVNMFGETMEIFTERFNMINEQDFESQKKPSTPSEKTTFNEKSEHVKNSFVDFLQKSLDETKQELKVERDKNVDLVQSLGRSQGETSAYKEKYFETQKLLRAPQTDELKDSQDSSPRLIEKNTKRKRRYVFWGIVAIIFILSLVFNSDEILNFVNSFL